MFLKTIYHPPHLQTLGKLYIVFSLRLSLFSFVRLSSRIVNYHQKMVFNFARRMLVVSEAVSCQGLDLRYSVIFGRIIDEKILQSQYIT